MNMQNSSVYVVYLVRLNARAAISLILIENCTNFKVSKFIHYMQFGNVNWWIFRFAKCTMNDRLAGAKAGLAV